MKRAKLETKKPPVKETSNKEPENKKQEPPENPVTTEEIEKKMLNGQEHISENPEEEKKEQEEEVKEPQKKEVIIKPRETYLQEKIQKMNTNPILMNNIQKELGNKVKNILKEENIAITEIPKDLNKYLPKEKDSKAINVDENYSNKQKYKDVKKMRDELLKLKKSLLQMEENEKLLKDEDFIKLSNSQKGYEKNTIFDKSIKEQQLKSIQVKKGKLVGKIEDLEYQIKNKMEEHSSLTNREKLKLYLDNFNRDKEIMEIKAKKFMMDSKKREEKMKIYIDNLEKKTKEKIEEDKKSKILQKEEFLKNLKDEEIKRIKERNKISEDLLVKCKPYINQKPEKTKKNYLYNKGYENFIKDEEKKYKDEYNKNKEKKEKFNYKFEDIEKFAEEYDEKLENRKYDQEQKSMELLEKWKENKEKLPKTKYLSTENIINNKNQDNGDNVIDGEEKNLIIKQYAENIREKRMPQIDEDLKRLRERIIYSLQEPKNSNKKYTLKKQKKNKIVLKKRDNSKPSKFKWELKLHEDPLKQKEQILNQNLIHRPKKINLLPISKTTGNLPSKAPDYLQELANKREEREKSISSKNKEDLDNQIFDSKKKSKKWEEALSNKKGNLIKNIDDVNEKVDIIEQETEQKEKLLQINGGIENNPKLGREVGSLLLDSIEAKINLLKKMKINA